MKAYLVTSPKFSGTAEIIYNGDGVLVRIDTANTDMDGFRVEQFKRAVGAIENELTARFGSDTTFVPTTHEITFEMWFNKYGYKVDKKRAESIWKRINDASIYARCWYGVEPYDRFLKRKGGKIEKMYPKTYLSSNAWETDWDKIK